jgi:hypothetical protein
LTWMLLWCAVLQVMQDFSSAKPSLGLFFGSIAPRLAPRFYSISSSSTKHPRSVHVTCAVIREVRRAAGGLRNKVRCVVWCSAIDHIHVQWLSHCCNNVFHKGTGPSVPPHSQQHGMAPAGHAPAVDTDTKNQSCSRLQFSNHGQHQQQGMAVSVLLNQ